MQQTKKYWEIGKPMPPQVNIVKWAYGRGSAIFEWKVFQSRAFSKAGNWHNIYDIQIILSVDIDR